MPKKELVIQLTFKTFTSDMKEHTRTQKVKIKLEESERVTSWSLPKVIEEYSIR
jgi:hypothetical protein